ncbi:MAG: DUF4919 domain-containing protein [Verrucomicrobiota bacterium]
MRYFFLALLFCATITSSFAVDFEKMRMDFADKAGYDPSWRADPERKAITDLWDEGKIDEGIALAEAWLKEVPVDIQMRGWLSYFYELKGEFPKSMHQMFMKVGLLNSITQSGTGLSPESPWVVISVHEEYDLLGSIGAEVQSQTLGKTSNGQPCDIMACKIGDEDVTFYFDVAISFAATSKLLNPEGE